MFAGVSAGQVLLAGGSNFPVPPSAGGKKVFGTQIWRRAVDAPPLTPWRAVSTTLPWGRAEGAAVTTEQGVVMLGGMTADGPSAAVTLMRFDASSDAVVLRDLPALPVAVGNAAAAYLDGRIYVAGGDLGAAASDHFWALDLAAALRDETVGWASLPSWPGAAARFGAVMAVLSGPEGARLALLGGRVKTGQPVREADYLRDGAVYDPATRAWTALPPMPYPALQAAVLSWGEGMLAVLGGSDGHDLARMAELGERYRIPDRVMVFDAASGRWAVPEAMPRGLVGAAVVRLPGRWLIAGGEYSPGIRTPEVYEVYPNMSAEEGQP